MEKDQEEKTLVLMRGVPGSGKSTKAKKIAGLKGLIYSTDDFFMKKGQYVYDSSLIGKNHELNLQRTIKAMQEGHPLIVIDNTNIKLWEMKKYVDQADKYGYQIKVQQPQTEWAWNYKQCEKKNTHHVPGDKIKIMIENYQEMNNIDDIRSAKQNRRRNKNK